VRIDEGRLIEGRCPHCKNLERRAFGESESDRGELASYALGWTAGHEDLVGYMTVGIGVGNPGGGTFHMEVRVPDDGTDVAMRLVDTPFERVPEGGADLARDEAIRRSPTGAMRTVAFEARAYLATFVRASATT
jgi:hypothetical protein